MTRNPYALSRLAKERHPESYCPNPRCLWLVKTNKGLRPCPKHMKNTPHTAEGSDHDTPAVGSSASSVRRLLVAGKWNERDADVDAWLDAKAARVIAFAERAGGAA